MTFFAHSIFFLYRFSGGLLVWVDIETLSVCVPNSMVCNKIVKTTVIQGKAPVGEGNPQKFKIRVS